MMKIFPEFQVLFQVLYKMFLKFFSFRNFTLPASFFFFNFGERKSKTSNFYLYFFSISIFTCIAFAYSYVKFIVQSIDLLLNLFITLLNFAYSLEVHLANNRISFSAKKFAYSNRYHLRGCPLY